MHLPEGDTLGEGRRERGRRTGRSGCIGRRLPAPNAAPGLFWAGLGCGRARLFLSGLPLRSK